MPGGDRTGPFGTFRNCLPVDASGNPTQYPFYGRGFYGRGFGRGMGRGFRWRYFATDVPNPQWSGQPMQQAPQTQQMSTQQAQASQQYKENEIKMLEQEMEAIKKRIEELKM